MDPEPPQPNWLVHTNLLTTAATLIAAESSSQGRPENDDNNNTSEIAAGLLQDLMSRLDDVLPLVVIL